MMFKISIAALMLCAECLYRVFGASFSKVYVQNGQEVIPLEYIQYGAPAVTIPAAQLAQLSAPPVGSVVPVASTQNVINPCNAPCIYTGPALTSVTQIASPAPNFITYKANVPITVGNSEEPASYEYSYVVYDDGTGDHKAQHETSDGAVVRGQYSFLQPDGYIREVHYTADDLNGFNAVVKKFLPVNVAGKEGSKEDMPQVPCHTLDDGTLKTSEPQPNNKERHGNEPNAEEPQHETHDSDSSDQSDQQKHSDESDESVEEHHDHAPTESQEKSSETLAKASTPNSAESESSEESVETHEAIKEQLDEPHHKHEASAIDEGKIHEIIETITQKPKKGSSYHDIIECIQNAIEKKDQMPAPITYIILKSPC